MRRSCYSDDYGDEFPGQLELYRANVRRSVRGKAGQARLRELRDALLALPTKELAAEIFAEEGADGPRVCALGAWALAKCGGDRANESLGSTALADLTVRWNATYANGTAAAGSRCGTPSSCRL